MATILNPNSCVKADCWLVFNDSGAFDPPSLSLGKLTLFDGTRTLSLCYQDILCGGAGSSMTCPTDGTAKVITVAVTAAPSSDCCGNTCVYGITISWKISCSETVSSNFEYVASGDAGDTTTTIGTALVALINANTAIPVTASGTTTITLTADEPGIDFTVEARSCLASGFGTVTVATPNVNPFGRPEDLIAMGVDADAIDNAATYIGLALTWKSTAYFNTQGPCACVVNKTCWIFVEEGGYAEASILTDADTLEDILAADISGALDLVDFIGKQESFCNT